MCSVSQEVAGVKLGLKRRGGSSVVGDVRKDLA
jgi:hypothetical protein